MTWVYLLTNDHFHSFMAKTALFDLSHLLAAESAKKAPRTYHQLRETWLPVCGQK